MQLLPVNKALRVRRLLRFNILFGLIVFALSVYLILTGEYSSLQERKATEPVYNFMAISSLVYVAAAWISCVMSKPFWFPAKSENH